MMIKLQDFASQCGVTDRAIQKHLKAHERHLEGHFERRGKNGTWLDETAQEYIRSLMIKQPIVVGDAAQQMEVDQLRMQVADLQEKLIRTQERLLSAQEALVEGQVMKLALEESKLEVERMKTEAAQEAQKAAQELREAQERAEAALKAQEAAEAALEALKGRNWLDRLLRKGE